MDIIIGVLIGSLMTVISTLIIDKYRNEFKFASTTYDKYLDKVLSYYANIYWYYAICADFINFQFIQNPNGTRIFTKKTYMDNLDIFVEKYKENKGYIRLILPKKLMQKDDELLKAFNEFRDDIINKEYADKSAIDCFLKLHEKKEAFEKEVRYYLRTEKIIK